MERGLFRITVANTVKVSEAIIRLTTSTAFFVVNFLNLTLQNLQEEMLFLPYYPTF